MLCRNVKPFSPRWNDLTTLACNHCGLPMKMTARGIRRSIAGIFVIYASAVAAASVLYIAALRPGPWNALVHQFRGAALAIPVMVLVVFLWSIVWDRCMEFRRPEGDGK